MTQKRPASAFWLTFTTPGGTRVRIVQADALVTARMKAALAGQDGEFEQGIQLDAKIAKKLPVGAIGKVMSAAEAQRLLKRLA